MESSFGPVCRVRGQYENMFQSAFLRQAAIWWTDWPTLWVNSTPNPTPYIMRLEHLPSLHKSLVYRYCMNPIEIVGWSSLLTRSWSGSLWWNRKFLSSKQSSQRRVALWLFHYRKWHSTSSLLRNFKELCAQLHWMFEWVQCFPACLTDSLTLTHEFSLNAVAWVQLIQRHPNEYSCPSIKSVDI